MVEIKDTPEQKPSPSNWRDKSINTLLEFALPAFYDATVRKEKGENITTKDLVGVVAKDVSLNYSSIVQVLMQPTELFTAANIGARADVVDSFRQLREKNVSLADIASQEVESLGNTWAEKSLSKIVELAAPATMDLLIKESKDKNLSTIQTLAAFGKDAAHMAINMLPILLMPQNTLLHAGGFVAAYINNSERGKRLQALRNAK